MSHSPSTVPIKRVSSFSNHHRIIIPLFHNPICYNPILPNKPLRTICAPELPSFVSFSATEESSSSPSSPLELELLSEKPAIIVAGFLIEELPVLRQLLDSVEGHEICMIPTTPDLLMKPVGHVILGSQEPAWNMPMPSTWIHGGGWGQKRVILFHDLCQADQSAILQIIEDNGVKNISPYSLHKSFYLMKLGEVLALAVEANQITSQISDELFFKDELPPVEEVLGLGPVEELFRMPVPSSNDGNLFLLDEIAAGQSDKEIQNQDDM